MLKIAVISLLYLTSWTGTDDELIVFCTFKASPCGGAEPNIASTVAECIMLKNRMQESIVESLTWPVRHWNEVHASHDPKSSCHSNVLNENGRKLARATRSWSSSFFISNGSSTSSASFACLRRLTISLMGDDIATVHGWPKSTVLNIRASVDAVLIRA